MKICVVGHGPSLVGAKKGELIDSHDIVVRLKACGKSLESPEDYGQRVDALCMSTEVPGLVFAVVAGCYWFYPKNGSYNELTTFNVIARRGAPFMIPLDLCNHWNDRFRGLNPSHPNVSTGMAGLIIAAHYYEPEKITLAGFDTLLDPKTPFSRNDVIPRTGIGESLHDWENENRLLSLVEKAYDTKIVSI